jgi:serine/threonine protein kinase/Tol biopolymer transport system component
MTLDRSDRIEKLFFAAQNLEGEARDAYLRDACAGDEPLRLELESLLTSDMQPERLWGTPGQAPARIVGSKPLTGRQLGIYQLTSMIGFGGMGEVYQALDTRLGREVAIKVLPLSFVGDDERVARFQREAQILAALNHRNIAVIHGLEQADGIHFLVMELVRGETLAQRIRTDGALPIEDALAIGQQLAEALEAAHDKQIIHRDLKPANIRITPEGDVKVLDFGLAKALTGDSSIRTPVPIAAAGTTTLDGVILGTPAYMSPEQARGKPVDKRTDIWAFGCVLFEMLTGTRAFGGETPSDRLAALLEREPPWQILPGATPIRLHELLQRCLQKDPRARLRDVGDARIEIEQMRRGSAATMSGQRIADVRRTAWLKRASWAAVATVAIAAAALAYRSMQQVGPSQTLRSEILPPEGATFGSVALSPDGRQLAFVASQGGKKQLWVRALATVLQRPLNGTDGAAHPFWSADNLHIGFFADGKLKRIPAAGGSVQVLAEAPMGLGGAWNEDGVIVFSPTSNTPLYRVLATGGPSIPLTRLDAGNREVSHRWPSFLPGGQQLFYFSLSAEPGVSGAGNVGALFAGSLDGTIRKRLVGSAYGAHYISGGYVAFVRGSTLLAQRFHPQDLTLDAQDLMTVSDDIESGPALDGPPFSVSESGDVLVYRRRGQPGSGQRYLRWIARDGSAIGTVGSLDRYWSARLSPDGRFVASEIEDPETQASNIWIHDTTTSGRTRFTFNQTPDNAPVWSPDSQSIVFGSRGQGRFFSLFRKPSNGLGGEQPLLQAKGDVFAEDWSRDGRFLLYTLINPSDKSGASIWVLPMQDRKAYQLVRSTADDRYPHFSPNGRWVAYRSNESGRNQIYVIPFGQSGGKWQISSGGGDWPVWRKDGQELYFLSLENELMTVGVHESGATVTFDPPKALFRMNVLAGHGERFAAAPDGSRFLALVNADEAPRPLSVVIHWK